MGASGGLVAILSTIFFDKIKVDDPVGAVSVHGTTGIWVSIACCIGVSTHKNARRTPPAPLRDPIPGGKSWTRPRVIDLREQFQGVFLLDYISLSRISKCDDRKNINKIEFKPKTYKISGTSGVIYINDIYSKKEIDLPQKII